ncbi:hypothetical protein INR49_024769, partial [Caranx melampygus]
MQAGVHTPADSLSFRIAHPSPSLFSIPPCFLSAGGFQPTAVWNTAKMSDKPDMTEIARFDKTKLKKTETKEKTLCPPKRKWVLLSSLGCYKGIWHPHMGVLLPL